MYIITRLLATAIPAVEACCKSNGRRRYETASADNGYHSNIYCCENMSLRKRIGYYDDKY